jgi:hypothetical protein
VTGQGELEELGVQRQRGLLPPRGVLDGELGERHGAGDHRRGRGVRTFGQGHGQHAAELVAPTERLEHHHPPGVTGSLRQVEGRSRPQPTVQQAARLRLHGRGLALVESACPVFGHQLPTGVQQQHVRPQPPAQLLEHSGDPRRGQGGQ